MRVLISSFSGCRVSANLLFRLLQASSTHKSPATVSRLLPLCCFYVGAMQVLSPKGRLTNLVVQLPASITASAAANSILAQANELLLAEHNTTAAGSSHQVVYHECHLLTYPSSSTGYPKRSSSNDAPSGDSTDSDDFEDALEQLVAGYAKRRERLLSGRATLQEVDASEVLNEPWWLQNELLVLLLPQDPAAAAAAAAAAVPPARAGSKRPAPEQEQQGQQRRYVLLLMSQYVTGYAYGRTFWDSAANCYRSKGQPLPLLLPLPNGCSDAVAGVKQALQVSN